MFFSHKDSIWLCRYSQLTRLLFLCGYDRKNNLRHGFFFTLNEANRVLSKPEIFTPSFLPLTTLLVSLPTCITITVHWAEPWIFFPQAGDRPNWIHQSRLQIRLGFPIHGCIRKLFKNHFTQNHTAYGKTVLGHAKQWRGFFRFWPWHEYGRRR